MCHSQYTVAVFHSQFVTLNMATVKVRYLTINSYNTSLSIYNYNASLNICLHLQYTTYIIQLQSVTQNIQLQSVTTKYNYRM